MEEEAGCSTDLKKKRVGSKSTFHNWQQKYIKEFQMQAWLSLSDKKNKPDRNCIAMFAACTRNILNQRKTISTVQQTIKLAI